MNPTFLSALAAAAWSVWTWQSEREKTREAKRDEMSSQYVNTFILVTQELQRVLFKILEEDELARCRPRRPQPVAPASAIAAASAVAPASPVAIDLLYHLSNFFGWGLINFRWGPYARDSKMIAMMAQIGELMESRSRFPGDAFRFTMCDRIGLGGAVVRPVGETPLGPTFMVLSRAKFEEEMRDEVTDYGILFHSDDIRYTLEAVDRAIAGEKLEGRERLAVLQNLLVDLLSYLEQQEGFRISYGERRRATVEEKVAVPVHVQDNVVFSPSGDIRILHQLEGRIRLGVPQLAHDETLALSLHSALQRLNYVKNIRVNAEAGCVVVEYDPEVSQTEFIREFVARVENELGDFSYHGRASSPRQLVAEPS